MSETSFDIAARTLECPGCGAPMPAPIDGGETSCKYCNTTHVVRKRTPSGGAGRAPTMSEDVARLSRLAAQLQHPVANNPYDLRSPPPGLSQSDARAVDRLRREWTHAKGQASPSMPPELQRTLVWLALRLADAEQRARKPLVARAVLETALDVLPDDGHRHLVLCNMVVEAAREGELAAAEAWLAECDPAAEVAELDNAHREAVARVHRAKRDWSAMLAIVGARDGEIPTAPSFAVPLAALRADAFEALGKHEEAYAALENACKERSAEEVIATFIEADLAPRAIARRRRADLAALAARRDILPFGVAASGGALLGAPAVAAALLFAVTISRCTCDADPFMGVHGDLICPHVCKDCKGPFRVYTHWEHNGGDNSTNGPDYLCRTSTNGVSTLSDAELDAKLWELQPYDLSWAPAAATYLTFLVMLFPLIVVSAVRVHRASGRARAALEEEIAALAKRAREPVPKAEPVRSRAFSLGLLAYCGAAALSFGVILLELAIRF